MPTLAYRLTQVDDLLLETGVGWEKHSSGIELYRFEPRVGWQRRLAPERMLSVLAGVAYTQDVGERSATGSKHDVSPLAEGRLEGHLWREQQRSLSGAFGVQVEYYVDPVVATAGPRALATTGLSMGMGQNWNVGARRGIRHQPEERPDARSARRDLRVDGHTGTTSGHTPSDDGDGGALLQPGAPLRRGRLQVPPARAVGVPCRDRDDLPHPGLRQPIGDVPVQHSPGAFAGGIRNSGVQRSAHPSCNPLDACNALVTFSARNAFNAAYNALRQSLKMFAARALGWWMMRQRGACR